MKMRIFVLAVILALTIFLIFLNKDEVVVKTVSPFQPQDYVGAEVEWTIERGIEYLEWARDCHIYFIEHPDTWDQLTIEGGPGTIDALMKSYDVEWNKKIASEYQQLIDWLYTLAEGK